MTGLSFFRTSTWKVSSVTTLVVPTCDHTPLTCDSIIAAQRSRSGFLAGQPALSVERGRAAGAGGGDSLPVGAVDDVAGREDALDGGARRRLVDQQVAVGVGGELRSEEHTSELQSQSNLVCRLLLAI